MAGNAAYKNKWQKENCDRVNLTLPKGKKESIKAHADSQKESVNSFINRAIDETIERDNSDLSNNRDKQKESVICLNAFSRNDAKKRLLQSNLRYAIL